MGLAGASTAREQVVAGLAERDGTAGRTDVDATFDGKNGRAPTTLRTDISVVHPAAASYVLAASKRAGSAAKAREARKMALNLSGRLSSFYGTISETGGYISAGFVARI